MKQTALDSTGTWAKQFIEDNTPKVLNALVNPLISKVTPKEDTKGKEDPNEEAFRDLALKFVYEAVVIDFMERAKGFILEKYDKEFLDGVDIGETIFRRAVADAMKEMNVTEEKIKIILDTANENCSKKNRVD